jgi:hypothetical protein
MFLIFAGIAGLLAAFFIHWLTWTLRRKTLTLAVILGVVSAVGLTGFFLLFLNSDIANMVLGAMAILYALVFAIGVLQARWLRAPGWKGVAALFFETALAFLTGAAVNLTMQRYIPWFNENFPGIDVYALINAFLWTMIIALLLLAVVRPLIRRPDVQAEISIRNPKP